MMGQPGSLLRLRWMLVVFLSLLWATMGGTALLAERAEFGRSSLAANMQRRLAE